MPQSLKILIKISAVLSIFALIVLLNILLQEHDIQVDLDQYGCNQHKYDLACLNENVKGQRVEGTDIGAYYMYFSSAIFVFLSLFLFNPKRYYYLTPILVVSWIILSEIFVRIFNIYVITTSLMGVITVFDSLYFGFVHNEIFGIIPLIIIISSLAGVIAYYTSVWIRKNFIKSHNSV